MVTLKEQVVDVLDGVAEQLTVVVPMENSDPEGGAQLIVVHPPDSVGE
jgi:hypothetical protein